ncbi:MAG TPA: hypothetical protein VLW55_09360 [Burkholderiaceae bacterium]|nr:hypothetical protein [Burkholderiaceae bacterium]
MQRCLRPVLAILLAVMAAPIVFAQDKSATPAPRQFSMENKLRLGDFDQIRERRVVRVLLPYSRTLFFVDKGQERGVTAENMRD